MALSLQQYRHKYLPGKSGKLKEILTKRIERQRKRSFKGVPPKHGDRIPDHLIIEILSQLPVRTLLQFKSVCKSWYAMIKSSHFISKHLRNYYDNDTNWRDCLLITYSITQAGELNVYQLLIDNKKNRVLKYEEIDTPVYNTYLCGPCDGIFYLSCNWKTDRSLWNPALNEFKRLPDIPWKPNPPPPDYNYKISEDWGFGYDSKTKDYKVILFRGYPYIRDEGTDSPMSILIYSLKTNSWRHWGDVNTISYYLKENESYVFVNGCYHWLGSSSYFSRSAETLITFDISAEVYKEIPLPQIENEHTDYVNLVVYQDLIGFVCVPKDDNNRRSYSVWTWNKEVWTQKLSMIDEDGVWGLFFEWRRDDMHVLIGPGGLFLFDTKTKETFYLDHPRKMGIEQICAYKESLVSIL